MGAIGTYREKGLTDAEFLRREGYDCIAASRKGGVIYAAIRLPIKRDDGGYEVIAMVSRCSNDRNGYFTYRLDDETMGPYHYDCPAKILDLLTPTDNEYANEWRAKCRAKLTADAEAKAKAKRVGAGTLIEVAAPLTFSRGGTFRRFIYTGSGAIFYAVRADHERGPTVSLGRDWATRYPFEIVAGGRWSAA